MKVLCQVTQFRLRKYVTEYQDKGWITHSFPQQTSAYAFDYLYFSSNHKINPPEWSKIMHMFMSLRNTKLFTFTWKRRRRQKLDVCHLRKNKLCRIIDAKTVTQGKWKKTVINYKTDPKSRRVSAQWWPLALIFTKRHHQEPITGS